MKISLKIIFIFLALFSIINAQTTAQNKNLKVPKSQIRLDVSAEEVPGFFSRSEIESIVKLQLRRNNIPYLNPSERESALTGDYPYLYINLFVAKLNSGDIYGGLSLQLVRFQVFQLSTSQRYDKDFRITDLTDKDGRGPLDDIIAWEKTSYFYIPKRYNQTEQLKEYLESQIDNFSLLYIDKNNL